MFRFVGKGSWNLNLMYEELEIYFVCWHKIPEHSNLPKNVPGDLDSHGFWCIWR